MTTDIHLQLGQDAIREMSIAAASIVPATWYERQRVKQPRSNMLNFARGPRFHSQGQAVAATSHDQGSNEYMHPVAETIAIAEFIACRQKPPKVQGRPLVWLSALAAVARMRPRFGGCDLRLKRLLGDQWKEALYELLTGSAYATSVDVAFLQEGKLAGPDIRLGREGPFVECKTKLVHSKSIDEFVRDWRRRALGPLASYLHDLPHGLMAALTFHSTTALSSAVERVKVLIQRGLYSYRDSVLEINITPFPHGTLQFAAPLELSDPALWSALFGVSDWSTWQHVWSGGGFQLDIHGQAVATNRPFLVCARLADVEGAALRLAGTVKDACKRQLVNHRPGLVHVLIDGSKFSPESLTDQALESTLRPVLTEYTRLAGVRIDLISPPPMDIGPVGYHRYEVLQPQVSVPPSGPVLLW